MRNVALAVLVLAALVFLLGQAAKPPKAGEAAPQFSIATLDGKAVSSKDLTKGGPVLLLFIGHSCPTTHVLFKHYNTFEQTVAPSGIKRYMVLDAKAAAAKVFVAKHGAKIPVLLDPEKKAFRAFGLTRSPATAILTKDGKVARFDLGLSRSILTATARDAYKLVGRTPPKLEFADAPASTAVG